MTCNHVTLYLYKGWKFTSCPLMLRYTINDMVTTSLQKFHGVFHLNPTGLSRNSNLPLPRNISCR